MIVEIIVAIIVILVAGAIWIFNKPLPPWYNLYGDEYKKWKRGEKGKPDNTD